RSWKDILELAPLPVLVTDPDGMLSYSNALALEQFWKAPTDLLNLRLEHILEPLPGEPGFFRSRAPEAQEQIWQIWEHESPDSSGRVHYLFDRTMERQQSRKLENLEIENTRLEAQA